MTEENYQTAPTSPPSPSPSPPQPSSAGNKLDEEDRSTAEKASTDLKVEEWMKQCLDDNLTKPENIRKQARENAFPSLPGDAFLAVLIEKLRSAFCSTGETTAVHAMYLLCGAMEGRGKDGISFSLAKLLGDFFVEKCERNYDDAIMDVGTLCLSTLLKMKVVHEEEEECIAWRLDLSHRGVLNLTGGTESGISTLIRSRRSSCFDLLSSALPSSAPSSSSGTPSLSKTIAIFTKHITNALKGESDPRCLLQSLHLLSSTQTVLSPLCPSFPHVTIFDTVAPYYPIQFTPPPNDVHKISRNDLISALFQIMLYPNDEIIPLSLKLFLERLTDEEDDIEKKEALEDIRKLLLEGRGMDHVSANTLRDLSHTLLMQHQLLAPKEGQYYDDNSHDASLSSQIRSLSTRILSRLENTNPVKRLAFFEPLREKWQTLSPHYWNDEMAITSAYLASLAIAGEHVLNECLDLVLPRFMDMKGDDVGSGLLLSIASFVNAVREVQRQVVVPEHNDDDDNALLEKRYVDDILKLVEEQYEKDGMGVPSVKLLECLILACPMTDETTAAIVSKLMKQICSHASEDATTEENKGWYEACANTVGSYLGTRRNDFPKDSLTQLYHLRSELGCMALARGCQFSSQVGNFVLELFLDDFVTSWKDGNEEKAKICVVGLEYVVEHGGEEAKKCWHNVMEKCTDKLLKALIPRERRKEKNMGMSQLMLPEKREQSRLNAESAITKTHAILHHLLPLYRHPHPSVQTSILAIILPAIPPLSHMDKAKISILLPLLSKSIASKPLDDDSIGLLLPFLCEFALDGDNDAMTRTAAVDCLQMVFSCADVKDIEKVLEESLYPELKARMEKEEQVDDVLGLIALVGSATSSRGGPITSISNQIIHLLLHLSTPNDATAPDIPNLPNPTPKTSLLAAKAFASILTSTPTSPLPFWKQRISYLALSHLKQNASSSPGSDIILASIGCNLSLPALGEQNAAFLLNRILTNLHDKDDSVMGMCLSLILKFMSTSPKLLQQTVPSEEAFVSVLLQILSRQDMSIPQLLMTIQCLRNVLKLHWNLKAKSLEVVCALGLFVDYPARVVRKAATVARNSWCVLE